MKHILIALSMLLCSQAAYSDTLLIFQDGSAAVWQKHYEKGAQICTIKAIGFEDCADKSFIVSMREVEPGTNAQEYGGAATGLASMSDNMWAAQYDENAEKNRKLRNDADDRARARQHAQNVKKYGSDRADQIKLEGNSVATTGKAPSKSSIVDTPLSAQRYRVR
ncbi:MAG: hypothetical protein C4586_08780 [Anaerolineaceae bacterium]|nr:MAG: hypothetical protein C4586_08780 [Anaerolineaceae bacterium]